MSVDPTPTFVTDGQAVASAPSEAQILQQNFWPTAAQEIRDLEQRHFKTQELPLARIKKIMKLDEDVKMISAEAPVLFAKAAEIFISELSLRAWVHTEENKRRTLQRNDIAMAITKYDQFDFLIDIVPRDELKPVKREDVQRTAMPADQVQYYFQLAQQQALNNQTQTTQAATVVQAQPAQTTTPGQTIQINAGGQVLSQPFQIQLPQGQTITIPQGDGQQPQVIQLAQPTQSAQPQSQASAPQIQVSPATNQQQIFHQVVTANGEVQTIQLTPQQLQAIQLSTQGKQSQPLLIQTANGQTIQIQAGNQQQQQQQQQQQFQISDQT